MAEWWIITQWFLTQNSSSHLLLPSFFSLSLFLTPLEQRTRHLVVHRRGNGNQLRPWFEEFSFCLFLFPPPLKSNWFLCLLALIFILAKCSVNVQRIWILGVKTFCMRSVLKTINFTQLKIVWQLKCIVCNKQCLYWVFSFIEPV